MSCHLSDRTTSTRRSARGPVRWIVAVALVLTAVMAAPWIAGRVYTRDDLGAFHLPVRAFYAEQLARGEPFDWMPHLYCGFYLTGEGQAGVYHPVHWLLYRFLPLKTALGAELLLTYPMMFVGTWFWLRRRLGRHDAALFGALVFAFSGFNLLHFLHPNAVAVVAHIPWLLWAIDVALLDASRRRVAGALAAVALLTGSQLLLGYPQYVWFSLLAEAGYTGFLLVALRNNPGESRNEENGRRGGRCTRLAIAKGCGLLLGGVQLLPTLDALQHSVRSASDAAFSNYGSLAPPNLLQLIAPYFFRNRVFGGNTHELSVYLGAAPLLLIVWLMVRRRRLGRMSRHATAAAALGLCALLLALGKYGFLYQAQTALPLVSRFRFPCRYLVLMQLAAAVLTAIGFAVLLRDCRRADNRKSWQPVSAIWAVVVLSIAAALIGIVALGNPLVADLPGVLAGPALLAAAAGLITAAARGRRFAIPLLVVLAAADLGCYGMSYCVLPGVCRLEDAVATVDVPPGGLGSDRRSRLCGRVLASGYAVDGSGVRQGNQITLAGWHRADGYAGLEPRRRLDFTELSALRAAGVGWVRREKRTESIAGLRAHNDGWLEVPEPLDRVRLVTRIVHNGWSDFEAADVETAASAEVPLALPPSRPGETEVLVDRPGRLLIRCDSPRPQMLVVAESYHPGWQARVEGKPEHVFRLNGDFLGCLVGPGRQDVELRFNPASLRRGRWATLAGAGLLGVLMFMVVTDPRLLGKQGNQGNSNQTDNP